MTPMEPEVPGRIAGGHPIEPLETAPSEVTRRRRRVAVGVVVAVVVSVVLLATFLRQEGVPKARTIWAEDGVVFAECALGPDPLACLSMPYAGYLHTSARLGALVAPLGDLEGLPLRLTLAAGLITAFAAALLAIAVYDVTASSAAGVVAGVTAGTLAGVGVALVDSAGREVLGNLTNLHWVLLTASVVVVICAWLGKKPGIADLVLLFVTPLSSGIAPFVLVPLSLVAVGLRTPGSRRMALVILAASVPQVITVATHPRWGPDQQVLPIRDVLSVGAAMVRGGWFGADRQLENVLVVGLAVAVTLALLLRGRYLPAAAVLALGVTGVGIFSVSAYLNGYAAVRFGLPPAALTVAAIALGTALLAERTSLLGERMSALAVRVSMRPGWTPMRAGTPLLVSVTALLALGFAGSFRLQTEATTGPDVVEQVGAARDDCRAGATTFELLTSPLDDPPSWRWTVPCARL